MSQTKWAVEDADTSVIEVNGRRFGANDDGAPLLVCRFIHVLTMGFSYAWIVLHALFRTGPPCTRGLLSHATWGSLPW